MRQTIKSTAFLLAAMAMGYLGGLLSQTTHKAAAQAPAAPPAVIQAQRFELVDAAGKVRGSFGMNGANPCINLYDVAGKRRGAFAMNGDDPYLGLYDAAEKGRGSFMLVGDTPSIGVYDSKAKPRGLLTMNGEYPELSLYDSDGKSRGRFYLNDHSNANVTLRDGHNIRAGLGYDDDQRPLFMLCDDAGITRSGLDFTKDGNPRLMLNDSAGHGKGVFVVDENNNPSLLLSGDKPQLSLWGQNASVQIGDKDFTTRLQLGYIETVDVATHEKNNTYPLSSIFLFDKEGTVTWHESP